MRVVLLLFVMFSLVCFHGEFIIKCQAANSSTLAKYEVGILKLIGAKLNINWDFSVEPCSGDRGWVVNISDSSNTFANNVTCDDCNKTTNVCHVTSIQLKGQNLNGELPAEFANLTHLNFLDLTRNYLNGSIPKEWASLPLTNLSLLGNRVSGIIPDELGNMSTLQSLVLEANQLEGPIPATLGKLTKLTRLFLSSNNFSGELPDSLGNLTNMSYFLIDGNPISGKIPSFIGNWTQLQRLDLQGTSLEGPFPSSFANLSSISQLRVSDIKGFKEFPPLQNMNNMAYLALRNLSITDELPPYIEKWNSLSMLDLSFNNLSGTIPTSFSGLPKLNYMFLTNNMLNGTIPKWIMQGAKYFDVSNNNFTGTPAPSNCQIGNANFVSSYSSTASNSIATCLQNNYPCSGKPKNYNLFINCGGSKVFVDGNEYEDDSSAYGASTFFTGSNMKWASSSTGTFMDNSSANYIATVNTSLLNTSNPELYTAARLSPLSLRYYGLCLEKGNYKVSLHFAEIVFTDDRTFSSVGKRLFDVWIQGRNVLTDFDVAKAANGTGKNIIKSFDIDVDGTLDIFFYWAGKGTHPIPLRSSYGPLISAISVTPNFDPHTGKISTGSIVGIVVGACAVMLLITITIWVCLRKKAVEDDELRGLELQTNTFSLRQIKAATNNFDRANKIGEGGFGPVYKGVLPDGSEIAVKQLSSKSKQGNREFITEVGMISALQHPNLVKLYGCGIEGNQLLLIYEYMENNSLARALFGPEGSRLKLDWPTRRKICLHIARGLTFLHEESRLKIVHRDIKATNILLDKDLNAKISDFGLAKLDDEEHSHISTRIAGTVGYMAPEYAMRGYLTEKADVYSFGVVMLEVVSGMSNTGYRPKEDFTYLLDWAYVLEEKGRLLELVDSNLGSNYSKEEALQMLNLCLVCTNPSPTLRPLMSTVVSFLEGKTPVQLPSMKPAALRSEDLQLKAFQKLSHDSQMHSGPSAESSTSIQSRKEETTSSTSSKVLSDYADLSRIGRSKSMPHDKDLYRS